MSDFVDHGIRNDLKVIGGRHDVVECVFTIKWMSPIPDAGLQIEDETGKKKMDGQRRQISAI